MARAQVLIGQEREGMRLLRSSVDALRSRLSTFTLPNGMRWIVLERHNAPVVACHTYANVGASSETDGYTGIAHLLEHLAFKGTRIIGTRNADMEAALLDQLDDLFYSLREAKLEGRNHKAKILEKKFQELQIQAASLSIPNEYGAMISRQGGVGLNAQTTQDATEYYVSLPANKLQLWMALESGRFVAPVFRELYSEKEVVKEERRLRVDNTPYGRFTEVFTESAFPHLPYGRPVIGYPNDFEKIGRREVTQFFKENYIPNTLTCAVVGDVDPHQVERLANHYFGGWGACCRATERQQIDNPLWHTERGWNTIVKNIQSHPINIHLPAQPFYMEGYYRPSSLSIDDPVISVISEVLSGGRLSRFYKKLILSGRALSATTVESFPGDQKPCLFLVYGTPASGMGVESLALKLHEEFEILASEEVHEDDIAWVKKSARASLLEVFGSNQGMARLLCKYEAMTGSCNNLFTENDFIEAVSPAEVLQVSSLLFNPDNCIKGSVESLHGRV